MEHDTWASLQEGAEGAGAWPWENQFAAYKTEEMFSRTPPDSALTSNFTLEFNIDCDGSRSYGPVNVSWFGLSVTKTSLPRL